MLLECRLLKHNARATGNGLVSPVNQVWQDFISECGVDKEWLMCKIGEVSFLVQIGAWSCWSPKDSNTAEGEEISKASTSSEQGEEEDH